MIKQLIIGFMQGFKTPWWAEITTVKPRCVYYFGPFKTSAEAKAAYSGYIEDLNKEGAEGIVVVIKRCNPKELTVYDE